jgi:hypothetical protein
VPGEPGIKKNPGESGSGHQSDVIEFPLKISFKKNQYPAIRIIVPIRIPNMDVDADSIPRTIYPVTAPIFIGV